MKDFLFKIYIAAIACLMMLSGCAITPNLLDKDFTKEMVPSRQTYFSQVWAAEGNNEFRVSGKIHLKGSMGFNVPDYVEVTLVDEKGAVVESQKVPYYPRRLTGRKRHLAARFTAHFTETPPSGTIIRLSNVN
ncbi:MAG: hypothetical protein KKD63_08990 [Proteobacteria bacterium]|nr:hypothetical protein [Desulfobulbaceae bacterium]MBU4153004.1 hypothetical protein [Pseudomonadota bacterium]